MQTLQQNVTLQGGKYRIISTLGQGGFGITYLAEQTMLERKVAVKEFFMKDLCNRDEATSHVSVPSVGSAELVGKFRQKFLKEARNIAKLNHPNIVRVSDVFEENGTAYYVMEYCENGSLAALVNEKGSLPEQEATRYIKDVASALGYIHQRKMNHLDVKPGNIMLNENNEAVLIDFGLSKQYDAGGQQTSTTPVGISHGYAPMEQYKQGGVGEFSPETDIYALGATFFKLLTDNTPPSASDINENGLPVDILKAHGVSQAAIDVISRAMKPRKRDRTKSIQAFLDGLNTHPSVSAAEKDEATVVDVTPQPQYAKPASQSKPASTPKPTPSKPNNAKKWIYIVGAAAVACLAVYLLFRNKGTLNSDVVVEQVVVDSTFVQQDSMQNAVTQQPVRPEPYKTPLEPQDETMTNSDNVNTNATPDKPTDSTTPKEQYRLGKKCYEKKDFKKAVYWYQKAAEQGYAEAQYELGRHYDITHNPQAAQWYQKAADQGYAKAQYALGFCYKNGIGVTKNFSKTEYWWQKAAEQGDVRALYDLGTSYKRGDGVERDDSKAVYWYQKAAEQGYAKAQCDLAGCYRFGHGVTKDNSKAVYWYQKAAEQGYAKAQCDLADYYHFGQGVAQDYFKAVYWYQKAAEQEYAEAYFYLGLCYEYGNGVTKDYSKAKYWYQKAADKGDSTAKKALERLAGK